jgi:hypothetical protein
MRLAGLLALVLLLASCEGLVGSTVRPAIRDGVQTIGEEQVRRDIETFALSPEVQRILAQLTRDLVDALSGSIDEEDVRASLQMLIHTAIEQIRDDTADLPPRMEAALEAFGRGAEAMVDRVVDHSLRGVRRMIDGDDLIDWAHRLLADVLDELATLADEHLTDASAHRIGHWMHIALGEVMADVELEASTQRLAHAAALGFGNGLADSLNGELGCVLHRERDDFVDGLREASQDAARPWMIIASLIAIGAAVMGWFYYRAHQRHRRTIHHLQAGLPPREVLREAGEDPVIKGESDDGLGPKK